MVRKLFDRVCREAGLSDVRLHDLRRTVATMAAASGVGAHVLRDLTRTPDNGHGRSDIFVTLGNPVREAREKIGGEIAGIIGC